MSLVLVDFFSETQNNISGQALKAIFKTDKYLAKFTNITVQPTLDIFDKLVSPVLKLCLSRWGVFPMY